MIEEPVDLDVIGTAWSIEKYVTKVEPEPRIEVDAMQPHHIAAKSQPATLNVVVRIDLRMSEMKSKGIDYGAGCGHALEHRGDPKPDTNADCGIVRLYRPSSF